MLTVFLGALIVLFASGYWGYDRCKREKEVLGFLQGLISLCDHTEMHIRLFRTPIYSIFEKFSDGYLENMGFMSYLRSGENEKALDQVRHLLCDRGYTVFCGFLLQIGSGYEEDQRALCTYTSEQLKVLERDIREKLPQKLRMYKLLPVLLACSVIILLI